MTKPRANGESKPGGGRGSGAPTGPKPPSSKPGRPRWLGRRRVATWATVMVIWVAVAIGGAVLWYGHDLPDVANLETPGRRPSITLVAIDGTIIATYGELHAGPVRFDQLPPHLVQAIIATEDRRFFDHGGFDLWAIGRAVVANLKAGGIRQGASTISQQLAKNLFLTPERTIRRKAQEILAAIWLETKFDKQQIFTIYVNRVYLGAGTYGVEAASRRYFGKSVQDVNIEEGAVLAGLLKAPSRLSPLYDPDAALERAGIVLQNMVEAGYLDEESAQRATRRTIRFAAATATWGTQFFADWVIERASGFIGHPNRDLVIQTTFDTRLQRLAEASLWPAIDQASAGRGVSQGAFVALTPNGEVRAMVGGRDYAKSQFNRASQALRQPGSAFKLFVYLAGLEAGVRPSDGFFDGPVSVDGWSPRNFDDRYRGQTTMRESLAESLNSVAVQIAEKAGRDKVVAAARRLGITSPLQPNPSLALGTSEVSLVELTAAYGTLANGGNATWPLGISAIRDSTGATLYRREGTGGGRVIAPETLRALDDMLAGVLSSGTGRAAAIGRPAVGKTGTSQDFRDAWFVGATADLVAGVWVGNDDSSPMKRVTGGGLPAEIWRTFMAGALAGTPIRPLPIPPDSTPSPSASQPITSRGWSWANDPLNNLPRE
jgi:penicillin-binding protein 1A